MFLSSSGVRLSLCFLAAIYLTCCGKQQSGAARQSKQGKYFNAENPSSMSPVERETIVYQNRIKKENQEGESKSKLEQYAAVSKDLNGLKERLESLKQASHSHAELGKLESLYQEKKDELSLLEDSLLDAENIQETIDGLLQMTELINEKSESIEDPVLQDDIRKINQNVAKLENQSSKLSWQEIISIVFTVLRLVMSLVHFFI